CFFLKCYYYLGCVISLGSTYSSNCFSVNNPNSTAVSFNVELFSNAVLAILAAFSYPICGLRAVTSIKEFLRCLSISSRFGSIPLTQRSSNESMLSANKLQDCRKL